MRTPTLRMWEQRYGLLEPKRTDSNIRYYDDEDLKLLLNVTLLNRQGWRISQIADLDPAELARRAAEIALASDEPAAQLDALTLSMLEMDEARFDHILSTHIRQIGFEQTMMSVIFPFLEKISILWVTGSVKPVQESFVSGLIRRKLSVEIESLPHPSRSAPGLVLFLPQGENQEVSLFLLHYLARKKGFRTWYLGRDVSLSDLDDAYRIIKPDLVFTLLTETFSGGEIADFTRALRKACPESLLLISGYQVVNQAFDFDDHTKVVASMRQTLDELDTVLKSRQ